VSLKKPHWIKVRGVDRKTLEDMKSFLDSLGLHTVCESAICPNVGTCFRKGTATFMILGNVCTRNCAFCSVSHGETLPPDADEPVRVAEAAKRLDLKHVVITSVTRDDLADGGALQFARTIEAIRRLLPGASTDVLIPDFQGQAESLRAVLEARPDILAHNLETVPRLYPIIRQKADYGRSLKLLEEVKRMAPHVYTKSGLMLGLGEKGQEVVDVMADLQAVGCDFLTVGQYLRPTPNNAEVVEYIPPEVFEDYAHRGRSMGFRHVLAGPFVRSSFHADEALTCSGT
jgi:lipoic acid synthetase